MVTAGPNAAIYRPIVRDCLGLGDCLPEPQSWRPTWSLRDHSRNPTPGMGFLWHVSDINYISDALLSIRLPSGRWRSSDYRLADGRGRPTLRRIADDDLTPDHFSCRGPSLCGGVRSHVWKNHRPVRTTIFAGRTDSVPYNRHNGLRKPRARSRLNGLRISYPSYLNVFTRNLGIEQIRWKQRPSFRND